MASPPGCELPDEYASLPRAEFAFPGPLRDRLVGAILSGAKTATTSLLREYEGGGGDEPMPRPGARTLVVDSADVPVAVVETTDVRVVPLAEVDAAHARDEGEGHETVAEWRAAHEGFWHGEEMRAALGDAGFMAVESTGTDSTDAEPTDAEPTDAESADFTADDATPVVLERFRVVADLRSPESRGPR